MLMADKAAQLICGQRNLNRYSLEAIGFKIHPGAKLYMSYNKEATNNDDRYRIDQSYIVFPDNSKVRIFQIANYYDCVVHPASRARASRLPILE